MLPPSRGRGPAIALRVQFWARAATIKEPDMRKGIECGDAAIGGARRGLQGTGAV
jgi:hypothetical protein